MDYTEKLAHLAAEISNLYKKERELVQRREELLVEEAIRSTEEDQPSAADQVAQALIAVHTEHDVSLAKLFGVQSAEVNTAGLLQLAEYRDAETIEMFLKYGADVNAKDNAGFSVLEMVLQGHNYHYQFPEYWNKAVLDILAKYNVDRQAVEYWIIKERCEKGKVPQYVRDFLGLVDDV